MNTEICLQLNTFMPVRFLSPIEIAHTPVPCLGSGFSRSTHACSALHPRGKSGVSTCPCSGPLNDHCHIWNPDPDLWSCTLPSSKGSDATMCHLHVPWGDMQFHQARCGCHLPWNPMHRLGSRWGEMERDIRLPTELNPTTTVIKLPPIQHLFHDLEPVAILLLLRRHR